MAGQTKEYRDICPLCGERSVRVETVASAHKKSLFLVAVASCETKECPGVWSLDRKKMAEIYKK